MTPFTKTPARAPMTTHEMIPTKEQSRRGGSKDGSNQGGKHGSEGSKSGGTKR